MRSKKELEVAKKGLLLCFIVGWIGFGYATLITFINFKIKLIPILIFLAVTILILVMLLIDTKNRLRNLTKG